MKLLKHTTAFSSQVSASISLILQWFLTSLLVPTYLKTACTTRLTVIGRFIRPNPTHSGILSRAIFLQNFRRHFSDLAANAYLLFSLTSGGSQSGDPKLTSKLRARRSKRQHGTPRRRTERRYRCHRGPPLALAVQSQHQERRAHDAASHCRK